MPSPETVAARESALLHVRADLAAFAVTGGDRLAWLNGLVTCDLAKLPAGSGAYGLAVGKTGKIMAELWFVAAADRVIVLVARDLIDRVRDHFDKHLVMEDAEIGPVLDRSIIFVHGPKAGDLVDRARTITPAADAATIDWTGRGDAAVVVAAEGAHDATLDALVAAAGPSAAIAHEAGWEALRIAWGVPRLGVDYDESTLPQEASLEKIAVSFTKGCYLGQETVFMLEKRGHAKKKLMRLAVEGDDDVPPGAPITSTEDGALGSVTSATHAEEGGVVALGYVKYKHAIVGTPLVVGGRAARVLDTAQR